MAKEIHRKVASASDKVEERTVTLDFTSEDKRGRLHAQPSDMMKRIWDIAGQPDKGDNLSVGISVDNLVPAGGNLAYTILMKVAGMAGGVRNIGQLCLRGTGRGGTRAVQAIELAHEDNFGVQSGRTARDYIRMAKRGSVVEPSMSVATPDPTRKVKDRAGEYANQCREVVFSRFPGTRTGTVCMATPFMLPEVESESRGHTVTSIYAVNEVKRLEDARQILYDEFNRSCAAIAVNMVSAQCQAGTVDTCLAALRILHGYLTPKTPESSKLVDKIRSESSNPDEVSELAAGLFDDLVHGEIGIQHMVSGVGFSRAVASAVRGNPPQVYAMQELRAERNIHFGLIDRAVEHIETSAKCVPNVPNAELALDFAANYDYEKSRSDLVEPSKKKVLSVLAGPASQNMPEIPPGSVVVCEKVPPLTSIPLLKTMGVRGVLAVEEVSRLAHEKIVAKAIGLPLAGGFHNLPQVLQPDSKILLDDQPENTHMVVLVDPTPEAVKAYGISEKNPVIQPKIGKHGGIVTMKDDQSKMYLGGTLQFIDEESFNAARAARPYGIGLIRLEIDMYHLGNTDWLVLGDDVSRRRLEAIYHRRARKAMEMWERGWTSPQGPLTFRLPDFTPLKMPPLTGNALKRLQAEQGIDINEIPMGIDLLMRHPEDFMLAIMKGVVHAIKDVHPYDFRNDNEPPNRKFKVYIELPSIETGEHLCRYYHYCGLAEHEFGVDGVFGRKVMIEGRTALENISHCIWGVDDVGIGSSDVTKDALGIQSRLDPRLNAMDPKALLLLNNIVVECLQRGIEPEVCGPMAEDPHSLLLLRGMGVSRVSVDPTIIDYLARHLEKVTPQQCERLLRGATRRDINGKPVYENGEQVFNYVIAETRNLFA
ncbi:MAG: putative PEP-binding protein [Candidatus Altiarchaeota archaeon]